MSFPSGANVVEYQPPLAPPGYRPGQSAVPPVRGGGRGWPQTFQNVKATNAADLAFATVLPPTAAFSIAPAATPTAQAGRSVTLGSYPVIVFIKDDSLSEVSPPLIVTGPQVYRFGAQARGLRLQVSSLAAGTDADFDVTIDPDPNGSWDIVPSDSQWPVVQQYSSAVGQNFGTTPYIQDFLRPQNAKRGSLWVRVKTGTGATALACRIWHLPLDGSDPIRANTLDCLGGTTFVPLSPNTVGGTRESLFLGIGNSNSPTQGVSGQPVGILVGLPYRGIEAQIDSGNLGTGGLLTWSLVWDKE